MKLTRSFNEHCTVKVVNKVFTVESFLSWSHFFVDYHFFSSRNHPLMRLQVQGIKAIICCGYEILESVSHEIHNNCAITYMIIPQLRWNSYHQTSYQIFLILLEWWKKKYALHKALGILGQKKNKIWILRVTKFFK